MSEPAALAPRGSGLPVPTGGERLARYAPRGRRQVARRRSWLVAALKFALPAAALAMIGLVIAWPSFDAPPGRSPAPEIATPLLATPPAGAEGDAQILNPRLIGADAQDRPFSVSGAVAFQDIENPGMVEIETPFATIDLGPGQGLTMEALFGRFDQQAGQAHLSGGVRLRREDGYAFATDELNVDFTAQAARSDQTVSGVGPGVALDASGLDLQSGGDRVVFQGPARLVLQPGGTAPRP